MTQDKLFVFNPDINLSAERWCGTRWCPRGYVSCVSLMKMKILFPTHMAMVYVGCFIVSTEYRVVSSEYLPLFSLVHKDD